MDRLLPLLIFKAVPSSLGGREATWVNNVPFISHFALDESSFLPLLVIAKQFFWRFV